MIDRDKLTKALAYPQFASDQGRIIVEAARLVADPDTLVISKVDGEWPSDPLRLIAAWAGYSYTLDGTPAGLLDALLEGPHD